MRTRALLLSSVAFALLFSCVGEIDNSYHLPRKTELITNFIIDPLEIGSIAEPPMRMAHIWNDSIIRLMKVHKLELLTYGGQNPDAIHDKLELVFTDKGQLKSFKSKRANEKILLNDFVISYPKKNEERIGIRKLLGVERTVNIINTKDEEGNWISVRISPNNKKDTLREYRFGKESKLTIDKIGDKISLIHIVIPVTRSINEAKQFIHNLGLTQEDLQFAQLKITYLKKGLPISTYALSIDWAQKGLVQSWDYLDEKIVTRYKEFINNNLIKDYTFNYTEDYVLRSIDTKEKVYTIHYN